MLFVFGSGFLAARYRLCRTVEPRQGEPTQANGDDAGPLGAIRAYWEPSASEAFLRCTCRF